ncbi:response regulator, partial [Methylogaea oryzae]|uniref:response regulator n=1 Tax=Methylogaea oryzae TaxID=1295382 RepID=UPI00138EDAF8
MRFSENMDRQGGDRYAVLFVDDEAMALEAFDMACGDSFPVLTASNAVEAARILESRSNDIAVLISDQRMPQTTGVDLLKETRRRHPHITRMLTTAYADFDATVAALNEAEIFRCIPKPWDVAALRRELRRRWSIS